MSQGPYGTSSWWRRTLLGVVVNAPPGATKPYGPSISPRSRPRGGGERPHPPNTDEMLRTGVRGVTSPDHNRPLFLVGAENMKKASDEGSQEARTPRELDPRASFDHCASPVPGPRPARPELGAVPKILVMHSPDPEQAGSAMGKAKTTTPNGAVDLPGIQPSPTLREASPAAANHHCNACEKAFQLKSSLARHKKTCGQSSRTGCLFCPYTNSSFAALRQHERRLHPEEYRKNLEEKIGTPEPTLLSILASIEVRAKKGPVPTKEMMEATELTTNQVRYRRRKPEYKNYLEIAMKQLSEGSTQPFVQDARPTPPAPRQKIINPGTTSAGTTTGSSPPSDPPTPTIKIHSSSPPRSPQAKATTPCLHAGSLTTILEKSSSPRRPATLPPQPSFTKKKTRAAAPSATGPTKMTINPSVAKAGIIRPDTEKTALLPPMKNRTPATPSLTHSAPQKSIKISSHKPPQEQGANINHLGPPPALHLSAGNNPLNISTAGGSAHPPELLSGCVDETFRSHLAKVRPTVDACTKELLGVSLSGSIQEVDTTITRWLDTVFPAAGRRKPQNSANRTRPKPPPPATAAQRRQAAYKKAQDLYQRDTTKLAEKIITGQPLLEEETIPDLGAVRTLYEGIFSAESPPDHEPILDTKVADPVYHPISEEEVIACLKNWSNSSPGPDGILVRQVKRCPASMLEVLFNVVLYRRHTPAAWQLSRTVLIPKEGDRTNPSNWRPLTIGSAVQRLMHRILARPLSAAVPIHQRQRGFRNVDGTLANIILLDHYIKLRRLKRKSYNICSLDIRKAFDSVSHHSITRALEYILLLWNTSHPPSQAPKLPS